MSEQSRSCFVISPIGADGSDTRRRSDHLFDYIITPAVDNLGFSPTRADKISESGDITVQIIDRLINDDLVIADLSERNPNVFYELAIRHVTNRPVILLIQKGEDIPFDVSRDRAIFYDITNLAVVERCKTEMQNQIKAFLDDPNFQITNPVSLATEIRLLSQSDNPLAQSNAQILSMMEGFSNKIEEMNQYLDNYTGGLEGFYYSMEALAEAMTPKASIAYVPTDIEARALSKTISSFNNLIESIFNNRDEVPESIIMQVQNLRGYLSGMIFQSRIREFDKEELNKSLSQPFTEG